jgi:hypothetical protein
MANLSETDRSQIYTELATATSPNTAEILMHEVLDERWEDLATKTDLAELRGELTELKGEFADLRSEMRVGFAQVDARFAQVGSRMDTGFARLDAKLEHQLHMQLIWLMGSLLTMIGFFITIH